MSARNGSREPLPPTAIVRSNGGRDFSTVGRVAAAGALILALVVIGLVILGNQSSYTLRGVFQNASGLVTGNSVLIGPAQVGTVQAIGLTRNGSAEVTMSLKPDVGPMHQGTVARIYEDSLSGIASKYIVLEPGAKGAPPIHDGGTIGLSDTYSEVSLDSVFDTLDPLTRKGLRDVIRGEGTAIAGKGVQANRTLEYFAPGLQSTSQVTAELTRDAPEFDALIADGARTMQALASKSQQLTQLISNTSTATGAIARQSQALDEALTLLPGTLRRTTTTFVGLRQTLDALNPLVAASKPNVRQLAEFANRLEPLINESIPTVAELNRLIHNPAGTGDLTQLALEAPSLARIAGSALPRLIKEMNNSQAQLDYLREYTPDVVGALTNLGQIGANYDANGHYTRTQPDLFPFTLNDAGQLTMQFPSQRYAGLHSVRNRCPGSAIQPSPDGSAPEQVPGCSLSSVPPGP
jgi:phospholipid/cholesterol/gamma-HCH transport system substrate-binding protein